MERCRSDCLEYYICNYFGLHTNVKFKAIFKINIINVLIIHVVVDFKGNHHKNWMNFKKIMDS
jgi:hypothetical protein